MTEADTPFDNEFDKLPEFVQTNKVYKKDLATVDDPELSNPDEANLISSEFGPYHIPVLDIDMNCAVLPSSTPGHHHLFIDKALTLEQYKKLVDVMVEVGIVQGGIKTLQLDQYGATFVRLPGIKKKPDESDSADEKMSSNEMADVSHFQAMPDILHEGDLF